MEIKELERTMNAPEAPTAAPTELGTEKIGKLLKGYALPSIIAMTASSLYNIIDSIYIGQGVGPLAISGLAITFPLMNLSTAFGTLVGAGASAMISVYLGREKYNAVNKVLSNVFSLNVLVGLLFMAVTLLFLDPILTFFGASSETLPYARDYMKIILAGNVITHLYFGLNSCLRSAGKPKLAMGLTIFTVVFNAILDPVFIFAFGWGIKGAAYATVLAQLVATILLFFYLNNRNNYIHFKKGVFRLDRKIAFKSLKVGMAPFLMNAAACIVSLFINQQLGRYSGDYAIGAYGIANRITFLFVMIAMGFNQGMQPIAGYNFGARKYRRVRETFSLTATLATIVMAVGWVVCVFTPRIAVSIFTHDEIMLDMAAHGLRMMNCMLVTIGFPIVAGNFFQSIGMVNKSIILSLSRQVILLLPLLYILPVWLGEEGVWLSFPISDLLSCLLAVVLIKRLMNKLKCLEDGEAPTSLGSKI